MIEQARFSKGIKLSYENAKRLNILSVKYFQKKLYEGSFFLAFAAWEEIGKALMILEKKLNDEPISKTEWKNRLKSHRKKIETAYRVHDLSLTESIFGSEYADKFRSGEYTLMIDEEFLKKMADYRLGGVYVDYLFETNEWGLPMDFSGGLAINVHRIAAESIRGFELECDRIGFDLTESL